MTLAFVDIETTGLDPVNDLLLEVGAILTDDHLSPIGRYSCVILHNPVDARLRAVPVVQDMHDANGLWKALATGKPIDVAEDHLLTFLSLGGEAGMVPMCGSSVHFDRAWLKRWMPQAEAWFHYRNLDVSTLKIAASLWNPIACDLRPDGRDNHRVLSDLEDTLAELRWYRKALLQTSSETDVTQAAGRPAPGDPVKTT